MNKPVKNTDWRGYDFDQLVYQRLLTKARLEVDKMRLAETTAAIRDNSPLMLGRSTRRILSAFSFIDYAVLAVKLFRKIKPIFSKK